MHIHLDPDVNALCVEVRPGKVARTVELTDSAYVDMDEHDAPLGIEFINADEFIPVLRDRVNDANIPTSVRALFQSSAA